LKRRRRKGPGYAFRFQKKQVFPLHETKANTTGGKGQGNIKEDAGPGKPPQALSTEGTERHYDKTVARAGAVRSSSYGARTDRPYYNLDPGTHSGKRVRHPADMVCRPTEREAARKRMERKQDRSYFWENERGGKLPKRVGKTTG